MSTTTTNFKLIKPELKDVADITTMNENLDKIDKLLKQCVDANSTVESLVENVNNMSSTITSLEENVNDISDQVDKTANPTYESYTILASDWTGDSSPYTYTLTGYDTKTIEVLEDVTMSLEQLEVIENAKIKSDPTSEANILYAFGDKPTIDVPVILAIRS